MFRKSCAKCKSHNVNILRSSNGWKSLHQFCGNCGTDQTAIGLVKASKTRKYRSGRVKTMKPRKAINYGIALVIWALLAAPVSYAITSDEKWGYQQTLKDIVLQALEEKRDELLAKIDKIDNKIGVTHMALVTKYNSLPEQTDDTPFITASGQTTRDGIVANNCLPFGSKVIINNKEYEVQDRMNKRYKCENYDIWSASYKEARQFGAQRLEVTKIVEL